jgi:short-subunit dehydrogenase|tara:strand:+ start:3076 stop:3858 length:783 start_codon:yes stop_codon:yes gene_type:complete
MKQVVWITGASSGIGAALVRQYCNSGHYVIATARSKQRLEKVISSCSKPKNVTILIADLEKLDELPQLISNLWEIHQGIDTVILNAGIAQWGNVRDTKIEVEKKIFNLNFWSPIQTIKLLLPKMQKKGFGRIICIGSIASQFGQRNLAAYSASKSALKIYMESLKEELYNSPIKVQIISPGNIKTKIMSSALTSNGEKLNKIGRAQEKGMSPEKLAKKIYRFSKTRRFHKIYTGIEGLALPLHRLSPKILYFLLRRRYAD